jgi:hypothetical protein
VEETRSVSFQNHPKGAMHNSDITEHSLRTIQAELAELKPNIGPLLHI